MLKKFITSLLFLLFAFCVLAALPGIAFAAANSNIDPDAKWAWSTNAGWINFNPPGGGAVVCKDHLEGFVWGENVGWIRLGTQTGCEDHTYSNTSTLDYGVNLDASGNLSGYAWGSNIGWINFAPEGEGGVIIDPLTGDFDGYAWGENIGWISFNHTGPVSYKVSMLIYRIFLPLLQK